MPDQYGYAPLRPFRPTPFLTSPLVLKIESCRPLTLRLLLLIADEGSGRGLAVQLTGQ